MPRCSLVLLWTIGMACDGTPSPRTLEPSDACALRPESPGCPCAADEPVSCYSGLATEAGAGECGAGLMQCVDGAWGACVGEVLPQEESCNERDDDCDGEIDEGVRSACGTCSPCERACFGPDDGCGAWGDGESTGVVETPEGWLGLGAPSDGRHVIWPSSLLIGNVLRVNTESLEIEGAYWSGPNHGPQHPFEEAPGATAVDASGSVVIANRGEHFQGSLTKIAADDSLCVDANENGRIDTSRSWHTPLSFSDHESWEDECILWHTRVGAVDAGLYSVVLHPEIGLDGASIEAGWVAVFHAGQFEEFDAETGELTGVTAPTPGFTPFDAAIDRDGFVWTTPGTSVEMGRFDTANPADSFETFVGPGGIANHIAVDENDAPWVSTGDIWGGAWGVWRWDRDREAFDAVLLDGSCNASGFANGALASDFRGSLWVSAFGGDSCVARVTNAPGEEGDLDARFVATVPSFGMGVDRDGHAWTFSPADGNASRIDLETEATDVRLGPDDCGGSSCLYDPWIHGDPAGLARSRLRAPGAWSTVIEGCTSGPTDWNRLEISADAPDGSGIAVDVRTAARLQDLGRAAWLELGILAADGPVFDLDGRGLADGELLEVRTTLRGRDDAGDGPVLRGAEVRWSCQEVVQ